jgi:type II secretion system protein J
MKMRVGKRDFAAAFTLIEIMIAISIFTLVMVAIYSSWSAIMRGSRTGLKAAAEVQRTRIAVRALEESLASAVMYVDNAKYYHFSSDTSGDHAYITFVARLPMSFPGSGLFQDQDLRRVTFFVKDGNLMLAQSPVLEATKKIGNPYTIALAPDVSLFDMEFYDGVANKWFAEWISTNQLPKMVRVALAFGKNNQNVRRPESMTIRSILLGGVAITRSGAGVMGGSGQGLVQAYRGNMMRPGPKDKDEELCGGSLPESFRSGATWGAKERNSLFPE